MVLSALGLSGASGLNAWLPLLLTGLLQRAGWVELDPAWAQLSSTAVLLGLASLFLLDFVADKIPLVDHALHVAGTLIHPVSGALVFDAQAGNDVPLIASLLAGGGSAGLLHAARATARPAVSGATAGVGAPVLSIVEDFASLLLVIAAFALPVIAGLVVIVLLVGSFLAVRQARRFARGRAAPVAGPPDRRSGR